MGMMRHATPCVALARSDGAAPVSVYLGSLLALLAESAELQGLL
jgi:hypothetical protein